jgi:hypothetical protein
VSVLSGALYGYPYIRTGDDAPASCAAIEAEARIVQQVYDHYTVAGLSIGAIARWLSSEGVPTRKCSGGDQPYRRRRRAGWVAAAVDLAGEVWLGGHQEFNGRVRLIAQRKYHAS